MDKMKKKSIQILFLLGLFMLVLSNSNQLLTTSAEDDTIHVDRNKIMKYGINDTNIPDQGEEPSNDVKADLKDLGNNENSDTTNLELGTNPEFSQDLISEDTSLGERGDQNSQENISVGLANQIEINIEAPKSNESINSFVVTPEWVFVIFLGFIVTFHVQKKKIR